MPELEIYDRTRLDWNAIKALAITTAKETSLKQAPALGIVKRDGNEFIDVLGPHWLLAHRQGNWEKTEPHVLEEEHSEELYVLMPNGVLMKVSIHESTTTGREGRTWRNVDDSYYVRPLSEDDAISFDFATGYYEIGEHGTPEPKVWGDIDRGRHTRGPLLETAKGRGLMLLLEDIRKGLAKQSEGLIVPVQTPGDTQDRVLPRSTKFHHTPDQRAKVVASLESARKRSASDAAVATAAEERKASAKRNADILKKLATIATFAAWASIPLLIVSCFRYMLGGGDSYDLPNEWFIFTGYGWIQFGIAMVVARYVLRAVGRVVEKA